MAALGYGCLRVQEGQVMRYVTLQVCYDALKLHYAYFWLNM